MARALPSAAMEKSMARVTRAVFIMAATRWARSSVSDDWAMSRQAGFSF